VDYQEATVGIPNLFLLGAPKCATTTIAYCIAQHPEVFMCSPKEPLFWATDIPGIQRLAEVPKTLDDYVRLFSSSERYKYVGEASAIYLYSRAAIPDIMDFSPSSRCLALVRNPVELAHSLHEQQLFAMFEDEADFERAWNLQDRRSMGLEVPGHCPDPLVLQYRSMALLGDQIQRAQQRIPAEQFLVILYDDFLECPRREYLKILSFLELPDDGRTEFPRRNSSKVHRFHWLSRWIMTPPGTLQRPMRWLRNLAGDNGFSPVRMMKKSLMRTRTRPPLSRDFKEHLLDEFRDDIHLLEAILGRDLGKWTQSSF